MVVCRPVLLASIKNTNNGRTMHRSSSIPRYSVVVKGKDIPGLTTPYTNEDCRHRGEWVWSTGPSVSLRSSRKTLRRRHFIYRTTAASVGAAWLCVLVAAACNWCGMLANPPPLHPPRRPPPSIHSPAPSQAWLPPLLLLLLGQIPASLAPNSRTSRGAFRHKRQR